MAEKIKIHFLGTGSSVPTARRSHTAVLLQYKNENILFDCGEGTQRQFRKAKLSMGKVTKILLSHWHGDHVLGLAGLLQTMIMNDYNKALEIYGPKGISKKVRECLNLYGIDAGKLKLEVKEVEDKVFFETDEFCLWAMSMDHGIATNGYYFEIKEKKRLDKNKLTKLKLQNSPLVGRLAKGEVVEIKGKKVNGNKLLYVEKGRKVSFIVDSRYCENAVELSKNSDLLICESSFSEKESDLANDHGHMASKDAANIANKAKVKNLALIHLSQRYDMIPKLILEEAKKKFKKVFIPEDLDKIEI